MCQAKKDAEEKAARELNELFAETIKQPKAPPGPSLMTLWRHPSARVCCMKSGRCFSGIDDVPDEQLQVVPSTIARGMPS